MARNRVEKVKGGNETEHWSGGPMTATWKKADNAAGKRLYTSQDQDAFKAKGYNQPKKTSPKDQAKQSAASRIASAFQSFASDPVGTVKKGAQAVGKAAGEAVNTMKQNAPKVRAEQVRQKDNEKRVNNGRNREDAQAPAAPKNSAKSKVPADQRSAVERVGQAFQSGVKAVAKATADPVGTVKKTAKAVGKAASDLATTAKENGYGPQVTATITKDKPKQKSKEKSGSSVKSTLKVTEEKKTEKKNKQKAQKNKQASVKSETISGPFNATEAMKQRRAAAEAAGKGKFNATEAMKQRRAAAEAAGKGKFNAQEEMKKRRQAAESKKRIQQAMNGKGK